MYVTCDKCGKHYDDAQCWTICPHYSLDKLDDGHDRRAGRTGQSAQENQAW